MREPSTRTSFRAHLRAPGRVRARWRPSRSGRSTTEAGHATRCQRGIHDLRLATTAVRPLSSVTVLNEAKGTRAVAFSPVYGTSTSSGSTALLLDDIEGALANTVMITDERRKYRDRFEHWKSVELAERAARGGPAIRQLGLE